MKTKRYSTSSSSDDEVLIMLKQAKECQNGYKSLRAASQEQCEFCDEIFQDRYTLYEHNIKHMIIPLITKKAHQCKECLRHFTSTEILNTHKLQHHNKITISPKNTSNDIKGCKVNIKENTDILRSILEKEVLVKCENDINVLVSTKLGLNGNNKPNKDKITQRARTNDNKIINTDYNDSKNDDKTKNMKMTNTATKSDRKSTHDDSTKNDSENIKVEKEFNLKEEPLSPELIKERLSSPIDDEKESIRHRLLFEEDVEDTLFRDISNECQVNIETLCQEVSFDFDDALVVSDSDDTVSLGCNDKTNNLGNILNNPEGGMNNFENEINHNSGIKFVDDTNDFEIQISNIQGGIDFEEEINCFAINNLESGINNLKKEIDNFKINGSNSIKLQMINVIENLTNNVQTKPESQFGKAIHCDILIAPQVWSCKYCRKEFPNRFTLIQHEPIHLHMKRHRSARLCCVCDRYIAGNHYTLRYHIARKHPENVDRDISHTTHNCPKCSLKYCNYTKHLRNYHEVYKCEICSLRFETSRQKTDHACCEENTSQITLDRRHETQNDANYYAVMQLCELCFSFMKIYMQNRQRYEEIGSKTELGVRQTCDKCNKEFFSVKLVKRRGLRQVERADGQKAADVDLMALHGLKTSSVGQKASGFGQKESGFGQKASGFGQKASGFGQKLSGFGQKASEVVNKPKPKSKPLSNTERLIKIRNRLKMMKLINKC